MKKEDEKLILKMLGIIVFIPLFSVIVKQNFGFLLWPGEFTLWIRELFYFILLIFAVFLPYHLVLPPRKNKIESFKIIVYAVGAYAFLIFPCIHLFGFNRGNFHLGAWKIFNHLTLFFFLLFLFYFKSKKKHWGKIFISVGLSFIFLYAFNYFLFILRQF